MWRSYNNFCRYTIFSITYAMCSTSLFTCIRTMIYSFTIFVSLVSSFLTFFSNITYLIIWFCFSFVSCMIFFFKRLINSTAGSLKNLRNFFMQSLALHTSCLFFIPSNAYVVDIAKPDKICSPSFVAGNLIGLVLLQYIC